MSEDRTLQFMELVDCDYDEVLDTAERRPALEAAAKLTGGPQNWEMPFGKHRGSKLKDVPTDYLEWAETVRKPGGGFRKFQKLACGELARREGGDLHEVETIDPLTAEYLSLNL